jgi:hypothetical protein
VGRSRRRHLHWLAASVLVRSRLLRPRRGVVNCDLIPKTSDDAKAVTVAVLKAT